MSPEEIASAMVERIRPRVANGMEALGAAAEARLKQVVSKQVGRSKGRVTRSKPGEAPRKDTGGYQASITHFTENEGEEVVSRTGSPLPLAGWLQKGTSKMAARNHYDVVRDRIKPLAAEIVKNNL